MLDPGTFGNTPAAKNLIGELEKMKTPLKNKFLKFVNTALTQFKSLEDIKDDKSKKALARILKMHLFNTIEAFSLITDLKDSDCSLDTSYAVSYAKNVISTRYKKIMRGENTAEKVTKKAPANYKFC